MHGVVSSDASLYYRCEIIASGPAQYSARIEDPRRGDPDAGSWGEVLLSIPEEVASIALPDSEIDIETGHNGDNWDDAPAAPPRLGESVPSPGPFSRDVQLSRLSLVRRDPDIARRSLTSFIGYATGAAGTVRELMGCVMAGSLAAARTEVAASSSRRQRYRVRKRGCSSPN
jgi:hypothetical protein